jgi:hypothetical protein
VFEDTLLIFGYRPEDDSWDTDGRRTYIHDDNVTRSFLVTLRGILARQGWKCKALTLLEFRHEQTGQILEIEPGGPDCTGHYLHHMKPEVALQ